MKFSTKLSLSFAALLAAALCAVGLAMVGRSFADGIASAGRTFSARQYAEKYSIESTILSQPVTAGGGYTTSALSGAVQSFAEQTPGSCMALYLDGRSSVYSNLPRGISRTDQLAALEAGTGQSSYLRAEGQTWLLLTVPLNIPGVEAVLLSAYDVTSVFASRDAQLTAWFVAAVAVDAAKRTVTLRAGRGRQPVADPPSDPAAERQQPHCGGGLHPAHPSLHRRRDRRPQPQL